MSEDSPSPESIFETSRGISGDIGLDQNLCPTFDTGEGAHDSPHTLLSPYDSWSNVSPADVNVLDDLVSDSGLFENFSVELNKTARSELNLEHRLKDLHICVTRCDFKTPTVVAKSDPENPYEFRSQSPVGKTPKNKNSNSTSSKPIKNPRKRKAGAPSDSLPQGLKTTVNTLEQGQAKTIKQKSELRSLLKAGSRRVAQNETSIQTIDLTTISADDSNSNELSQTESLSQNVGSVKNKVTYLTPSVTIRTQSGESNSKKNEHCITSHTPTGMLARSAQSGTSRPKMKQVDFLAVKLASVSIPPTVPKKKSIEKQSSVEPTTEILPENPGEEEARTFPKVRKPPNTKLLRVCPTWKRPADVIISKYSPAIDHGSHSDTSAKLTEHTLCLTKPRGSGPKSRAIAIEKGSNDKRKRGRNPKETIKGKLGKPGKGALMDLPEVVHSNVDASSDLRCKEPVTASDETRKEKSVESRTSKTQVTEELEKITMDPGLNSKDDPRTERSTTEGSEVEVPSTMEFHLNESSKDVSEPALVSGQQKPGTRRRNPKETIKGKRGKGSLMDLPEVVHSSVDASSDLRCKEPVTASDETRKEKSVESRTSKTQVTEELGKITMDPGLNSKDDPRTERRTTEGSQCNVVEVPSTVDFHLNESSLVNVSEPVMVSGQRNPRKRGRKPKETIEGKLGKPGKGALMDLPEIVHTNVDAGSDLRYKKPVTASDETRKKKSVESRTSKTKDTEEREKITMDPVLNSKDDPKTERSTTEGSWVEVPSTVEFHLNESSKDVSEPTLVSGQQKLGTRRQNPKETIEGKQAKGSLMDLPQVVRTVDAGSDQRCKEQVIASDKTRKKKSVESRTSKTKVTEEREKITMDPGLNSKDDPRTERSTTEGSEVEVPSTVEFHLNESSKDVCEPALVSGQQKPGTRRQNPKETIEGKRGKGSWMDLPQVVRTVDAGSDQRCKTPVAASDRARNENAVKSTSSEAKVTKKRIMKAKAPDMNSSDHRRSAVSAAGTCQNNGSTSDVNLTSTLHVHSNEPSEDVNGSAPVQGITQQEVRSYRGQPRNNLLTDPIQVDDADSLNKPVTPSDDSRKVKALSSSLQDLATNNRKRKINELEPNSSSGRSEMSTLEESKCNVSAPVLDPFVEQSLNHHRESCDVLSNQTCANTMERLPGDANDGKKGIRQRKSGAPNYEKKRIRQRQPRALNSTKAPRNEMSTAEEIRLGELEPSLEESGLLSAVNLLDQRRNLAETKEMEVGLRRTRSMFKRTITPNMSKRQTVPGEDLPTCLISDDDLADSTLFPESIFHDNRKYCDSKVNSTIKDETTLIIDSKVDHERQEPERFVVGQEMEVATLPLLSEDPEFTNDLKSSDLQPGDLQPSDLPLLEKYCQQQLVCETSGTNELEKGISPPSLTPHRGSMRTQSLSSSNDSGSIKNFDFEENEIDDDTIQLMAEDDLVNEELPRIEEFSNLSNNRHDEERHDEQRGERQRSASRDGVNHNDLDNDVIADKIARRMNLQKVNQRRVSKEQSNNEATDEERVRNDLVPESAVRTESQDHSSESESESEPAADGGRSGMDEEAGTSSVYHEPKELADSRLTCLNDAQQDFMYDDSIYNSTRPEQEETGRPELFKGFDEDSASSISTGFSQTSDERAVAISQLRRHVANKETDNLEAITCRAAWLLHDTLTATDLDFSALNEVCAQYLFRGACSKIEHCHKKHEFEERHFNAHPKHLFTTIVYILKVAPCPPAEFFSFVFKYLIGHAVEILALVPLIFKFKDYSTENTAWQLLINALVLTRFQKWQAVQCILRMAYEHARDKTMLDHLITLFGLTSGKMPKLFETVNFLFNKSMFIFPYYLLDLVVNDILKRWPKEVVLYWSQLDFQLKIKEARPLWRKLENKREEMERTPSQINTSLSQDDPLDDRYLQELRSLVYECFYWKRWDRLRSFISSIESCERGRKHLQEAAVVLVGCFSFACDAKNIMDEMFRITYYSNPDSVESRDFKYFMARIGITMSLFQVERRDWGYAYQFLTLTVEHCGNPIKIKPFLYPLNEVRVALFCSQINFFNRHFERAVSIILDNNLVSADSNLWLARGSQSNFDLIKTVVIKFLTIMTKKSINDSAHALAIGVITAQKSVNEPIDVSPFLEQLIVNMFGLDGMYKTFSYNLYVAARNYGYSLMDCTTSRMLVIQTVKIANYPREIMRDLVLTCISNHAYSSMCTRNIVIRNFMIEDEIKAYMIEWMYYNRTRLSGTGRFNFDFEIQDDVIPTLITRYLAPDLDSVNASFNSVIRRVTKVLVSLTNQNVTLDRKDNVLFLSNGIRSSLIKSLME